MKFDTDPDALSITLTIIFLFLVLLIAITMMTGCCTKTTKKTLVVSYSVPVAVATEYGVTSINFTIVDK